MTTDDKILGRIMLAGGKLSDALLEFREEVAALNDLSERMTKMVDGLQEREPLNIPKLLRSGPKRPTAEADEKQEAA